jgi:hypothetical protein
VYPELGEITLDEQIIESLDQLGVRTGRELGPLSAEQDRVAGEAEMIKDFVALHKSLGLGWQS